MTNNSLDRETLERLTQSFTETFNGTDIDAMMSYFASDGILYDQHDGAQANGEAAIRDAFQPQFDGDFGAMQFTTEDLFVDPKQGKTMVSWLCSFDTKRGRTGWRGLDILHFNELGKITVKRTYAKAKVLQLDLVESK